MDRELPTRRAASTGIEGLQRGASETNELTPKKNDRETLLKQFLAVATFCVLGVSAALGDDGAICAKMVRDNGPELTPMTILQVEKAAKKSEYETTAAYEERMAGIIPQGVVVFSIPLDGSLFEYDADKGLLSLSKNSMPSALTLTDDTFVQQGKLEFPEYETVNIASKTKTLPSVLAQNAFGAKARVKVSEVTSFGVGWARGTLSRPTTDFILPASAEQAPTLRKKFRILFYGKLTEPYAFHHSGGGTFGNPPTVITSEDSYLLIQPVCASLYEMGSRQTSVSWSAQ